MKKIKIKKYAAWLTGLLVVLMLIANAFQMQVKAYEAARWETMPEIDIREDNSTHINLFDINRYGYSQTVNVGAYQNGTVSYNDLMLEDSSRLQYAKKIRCNNRGEQTINIIGAAQDTAVQGGEDVNDGFTLYWSVAEWDINGNLLYDGDWRTSIESWQIGVERNKAEYGSDGYPPRVDAEYRAEHVAYVTIVFRLNNGDLAYGSGTDKVIGANTVKEIFPNLYLCYNPFTYTFDYNGGTADGETQRIHSRLGLQNIDCKSKLQIEFPVPIKEGYIFTGWKLVSSSNTINRQKDWLFQLSDHYIFNDGKYYSSFFGNVRLEAQWVPAYQFVSYIGNSADNKEDYYKSYMTQSDSYYDAINFGKTGYLLQNTWEARDKNGNYWYSPAEGEMIPKLSGNTAIRTKVNAGYAVDVTGGGYNDGTNIECWECLDHEGQRFSFEHVKEENGIDYWAIRNTINGKVLDVAAGSGVNGSHDGANVQLWTYNGGDNQLWSLEMAGEGYFYIKSKLDCNLVLDLWGTEAGNGKNIVVSAFHGRDNQKWCLWDNSIHLYANWDKTTYKVSYDPDGGILLDENGAVVKDMVKEYDYDTIYHFYKAERSYKVSYETNGGTVSVDTFHTNAQAIFNGWNEILTEQTDHGVVNGWDGWCLGEWNWAAYFNGNPDLMKATGNIYDTMWAILHYRQLGMNEGRTFNGNSYWLPAIRFKNLTANGKTVYVKANYTNGSVILPEAEKESERIDGTLTSYTFAGWYSDSALTKYVGAAGESYTPSENSKLYAKFIQNVETLTVGYTVNHYVMDAEGNYSDTPQKTEKRRFAVNKEILLADLKDNSLEQENIIQYAYGTYKGNVTTSVMAASDTTLDLYYDRKIYTVTLNGDGGIHTERLMGAGTYYAGSQVAISAETLFGYQWRAWSGTDITYIGNTSAAHQTAVFVMPGSDVSLKANTDKGTFTVIYNYQENGGVSSDVDFMQMAYLSSADLTVRAKKPGWEFAGWSTQADASEGLKEYVITEDVTLYAIYRKTITTTFIDCTGKTVVDCVIYNTAASGMIHVPQIEDYHGWKNVSDVRIIGYNSNQDILGEGSETCEIASGTEDFCVEEDKTYYAVYAADAAMSYELNGGTFNDTVQPIIKTVYCNASDTSVIKGIELILGESKKTDYDDYGYIHTFQFAGWEENGEGGQRYASGEKYLLLADTVMYAVWSEVVTPVAYLIKYDGNLGTAVDNVPDFVEAQYGVPVQLSEQIPERTAFRFQGWNTRADGSGISYKPGQIVENLTTVNGETVILYGQWEKRGFQLIKAASNRYHASMVKRTENDEEWYEKTGKLSIRQLLAFINQSCQRIWTFKKN